MGSINSSEYRFSCHDRHSVAAVGLNLYREPARRGRSLALAMRGLDLWRTSEWGLAGEHHWTYSGPARKGRGLALATWAGLAVNL